MLLTPRKKQLVIAISLLYAATQTYAQTEGYLYTEEGNIEVKKVINSNPLGGSLVEYVKTRVNPNSEAKVAETAASKPSTVQPSTLETKEKPQAVSKVATKRLSMVEQSIANGLITENMPDHESRLVIQTENPTGKERELLAQIKEKQQIKNRLKKDVRVLPQKDLMLSPGEELVTTVEEEQVENNRLKKDVRIVPQKDSILTPGEGVVTSPKPDNKQNLKKYKHTKTRYDAKDVMIGRLEFKEANMRDVIRALADISGLNFVATDEAAKKNITVFLQNISVKDALEGITKNAGLWYRQDKQSGTFRIMSTKEYQKDLVVYREDITKVYRLHQPNPVIVATAIRDLYGERVILSFGTEYDDFFTRQFNSGGGGVNVGGGNNRSRGGARGGARGGGRGQGSLRGGRSSGIAGGGRGGAGNLASLNNNNNRQQKFDEEKFGANVTGAITENLTADQLEKIESAVNNNDGNQVDGGSIRGVTRTQQPIYVTVNNQQNMVILRTSDTIAVAEINALIKEIDQPTPQVLLEMQVLEVDVGDAYTQLFSFNALSKNRKSNAIGVEDDDITNKGKFVYTFLDDLISVKLELLQETNQAKVVSSPILLASNNRTSRLFVGEERLLIRGATLTDATFNQNGGQQTPSRLTYETEIRNIGNTLNITPKINSDGTVTLGIFQDSSSVNVGAVELPLANGQIQINLPLDTVNTANVEGVVVAKDGLTIAIGGLISTSNSKRNSKIPVLGDLPYIGGLFNDKVEAVNRKEMVLLITPHIMEDPSVTDDMTRDVVEPISIQEW